MPGCSILFPLGGKLGLGQFHAWSVVRDGFVRERRGAFRCDVPVDRARFLGADRRCFATQRAASRTRGCGRKSCIALSTTVRAAPAFSGHKHRNKRRGCSYLRWEYLESAGNAPPPGSSFAVLGSSSPMRASIRANTTTYLCKAPMSYLR